MVIMEYFKKPFTLIFSLAVLVGIPYYFGAGWLFLSWIPSLFVFTYLDE